MANLDWAQCPAVESVADRRSGEWVFCNTRMPVATVFENLELGTSIEEIIEQYDVTRKQIETVLAFAARSLAAPPIALPRLDMPCQFRPVGRTNLMRILFDQGVPKGLRASLIGHEVTEARSLKWEETSNGELLELRKWQASN